MVQTPLVYPASTSKIAKRCFETVIGFGKSVGVGKGSYRLPVWSSTAFFESTSSARMVSADSSRNCGWVTVCEPKETPRCCNCRTSGQVRHGRPLKAIRSLADECGWQVDSRRKAKALKDGLRVFEKIEVAVVEGD